MTSSAPAGRELTRDVTIGPVGLGGLLGLPDASAGIVLFVHGSGSGRRLALAMPLDEIRNHARDQLADLPAALKRLDPFSYRVEIGSSLRAIAAELDRGERAGSASF